VSQDIEELSAKKNWVYATAMHDIGWAAIGRYPPMSKMGGCDLMKSVDEIKTAILWTLGEHPDYYVVFEGMMVSTIKTTFYNYLMELRYRHPQIHPRFVILKTSLDGCVNRIIGRGTMKPGLNTANIYNKAQSILAHAKTYDQKYVRYIDVESLELEEMLPAFLKAVNDKELIERLALERA
jgi:hypothetical protein